VFVFKRTVVGTIEEKIEVLKERKAQLAASLFDPDGPAALDITEAEIERLFGASSQARMLAMPGAGWFMS
jgi:SNF2 family DNA or RNA helicase